MKLLIILVAVVATITNAENFRLPIHKALAKDRSGLSHSRYVMDYYRHLDIASVRRHDLSNKT
jgi:hypothetical protein